MKHQGNKAAIPCPSKTHSAILARLREIVGIEKEENGEAAKPSSQTNLGVNHFPSVYPVSTDELLCLFHLPKRKP
jgi:hypothetical protein